MLTRILVPVLQDMGPSLMDDLESVGVYRLRPAFKGRRLFTVVGLFAVASCFGIGSYAVLTHPPYTASSLIFAVVLAFLSVVLVLLCAGVVRQSVDTRGTLEIRDTGVTVWPLSRRGAKFLAWYDIALVRADTQDRSGQGLNRTTFVTFVPQPGAPAVESARTPREGSWSDYSTSGMGPSTAELRWALRRASIPLAPLTPIPVEEIAAEIARRSDVPFINDATPAGTARQRRRAASRTRAQ